MSRASSYSNLAEAETSVANGLKTKQPELDAFEKRNSKGVRSPS